MSSNETNKNYPLFQEFKFPITRSQNNSLIEEQPSNTPVKDIFLLKPRMNMSNILVNLNLSNLSPNKYSFDPRLFTNGYNSGNKNSNSGFGQEKMNSSSKLYFNSIKKEKKFLGKKRRFKYILSSEKKFQKNEINIEDMDIEKKNINIKQISLHGHHLLNLQFIKNDNKFNIKNISFSKKLLKKLTKKFHFFNLIPSINNNDLIKKEYNLENINLTSNELTENNLDYYSGEINCEKILKNYCEEIQNTLEKIQKNYFAKKKFIYITKNILLLELLIRNCNLFTNYLIKKYPQYNSINLKDNSSIGKIIVFSAKQLTNKKFLETLPENHSTIKKNDNISSPNDNNNILISNQKTALFKAKIPLVNTYKCEFCDRVFKNGQALGGHISQSHPKQSYKYKQKIEIRNSRTDRRELLYEARRRLFKAYNIDLEYLIKNKRKNEIKNFIKIHKLEYKKELIALKNYSNNAINNSTIDNKEIKDKNNSEINNSDK